MELAMPPMPHLRRLGLATAVAMLVACDRTSEPAPPAASQPSPAARAAQPSEADLERMRKALDAGDKIEAIRLYREITGCGLAEAKAAVDAIGDDPRGDVLGRPDATVWVESRVSRVDGALQLKVDTSRVVVRRDSGESRPAWIPMASKIDTTIAQSGDENSAVQSVKGTITYIALVRQSDEQEGRGNFLSCAFEFTEESVPGTDGVRWWRLKRVAPRDEHEGAGQK